MSFDFKLDKDSHDLFFENGDLTFTKKIDQELGQRLKIKLNTFETEWFIDQTYGIPYSQEIIGKARNKRDVDTIFISEVRAEEGVNSIESYSSEWDKLLRVYKLKLNVLTTEGTIPIAVETNPQTEWIYPDFGDDNPRTDCGLDDVKDYVNKLYEFININGLPESTYSTWINGWD